ncbi:CRE-binding bZIP protein SKO1 [Pseudozyma hubeiensis]|nr:CRE-binding bZIP protein SKO1 [Pseudozyma hubeiensis]
MSETATRPPAKPLRRSSPARAAKHHLEPNPFEKSFSSGPNSSESVERRSDLKADAKSTNVSTPPLSTRPGAAYRDRTFSNNKNQTSPQETTGSTPKPLLPPVASITSPAGENNPYPWSAGLTSSLRSGPLSPAMLAGPQSSHFDPNSFRTGFTPDLSNFKTGLTPLGGGMSFPPPSPNTAAFLAAMVNSTSGASTSAATITPNTLSALTNAAAAATNGGSMDPSAAGGPALSTQPQNFAGKPTDAQNAFDLAFSRSFPNERADAKLAGSKLKAEVKAGDSDRSVSQSISPQMMQKPLEGGANGDQQNAASGLFLLSRAHQEMAKRDGGAGGGASSTSLYESKPQPKKGANAKNAKEEKPGANKRKKSNSTDDSNATAAAAAASGSMNAPPPAKAAKTAKGGKKAAAAAAAAANADAATGPSKGATAASKNGGGSHKSDNGDDDDQQWDSDDEDGKGGNMDEKRKNFLERNRQAALKCRQRKKAWLASLQAKVEYLQNDNENLQNTVGALRNENMFLKSQLVQATGGAMPGVGMPMGPGPMGLPMAGVEGHPGMGPGGMGMPHPAYMHPGPGGGYVRGGGAPGFDPRQQQGGQGGRPRSEGDVLAAAGEQGMNGVKHEREWSAASGDTGKNAGAGAGAAGGAIKV